MPDVKTSDVKVVPIAAMPTQSNTTTTQPSQVTPINTQFISLPAGTLNQVATQNITLSPGSVQATRLVTPQNITLSPGSAQATRLVAVDLSQVVRTTLPNIQNINKS